MLGLSEQKRRRNKLKRTLCRALFGVLLAGLPWALSSAGPAVSAPLVVATTTIVGDVVGEIAGERVQLTVLLPTGTDPHSFEPRPAAARLLSEAAVVFAVGAGLEEQLHPLFEAAGARVSELAPVVPLLAWEEDDHDHDHDHGQYDPHVWMDPSNVILWTYKVTEVLTELDPAGAAEYAARAAAYREKLEELHSWIEEELERIPPARRLLVTDHRVLGYFAHRYGFQELGAVIPALSTLAEPSPREVAELVSTVRELAIQAVFVGATVNPALSEAVAQDAGAQVVRLYTESLSPASGPAPTYIDLMRYNVRAIVEALEAQ